MADRAVASAVSLVAVSLKSGLAAVVRSFNQMVDFLTAQAYIQPYG
jgi:hypothetical protein